MRTTWVAPAAMVASGGLASNSSVAASWSSPATRWLQVNAAVEDARATLAHARKGLVAEALGEPIGSHGNIPVEDAELALQRAENRLTAATEAKATVIGLLEEAENRLSSSELRVDAGADALMTERLSPHTRSMWEWHARKQREAAEADQVVRHLRLNKYIGTSHLPPVSLNAFDATQVWKHVEAALRGDANAKLPPIPGSEVKR